MRWVLVSMLTGCITVEVSSGEPWVLGGDGTYRDHGVYLPDGTDCLEFYPAIIKDPNTGRNAGVARLEPGGPEWKRARDRAAECCEAMGARLAFGSVNEWWCR